MATKRFFVTGLLVCALAFVGCGSEKDSGTTGPGGGSAAAPKASAVSTSLASLVPTNAFALVYVKNLGDLEGKAIELVGKIDKDLARDINLRKMVGGMLQGAAEQWDANKPMAMAVPMPAEGQDLDEAMGGMSLILGMKDAEKAKTSLLAAMEERNKGIPEEYRRPLPEITVAGDYLCMPAGPGTANVKRGGAKIAATAPDGDIGLRIDLAALVDRYRKDIDEGLADMEKGIAGGLPGMPPSAAGIGDMFKGLATWVKDFVNSAETLDIGITIEGSEVDFAVGFVAKAGSTLDKPSHDHSGLAAMAKHLPEGMPINALLSMDMGSMMEWLKPLMKAGMDAMPEDVRAKFQAYIDKTTEMTKLLGKNWAMSMSMGEKGLEGVQIGECKDAATYLQKVDELFAGDVLSGIPGFEGSKGEPTKVAGVDVHTYELKFKLEELMKMSGAQDRDVPPEVLQKMQGFMKAFLGGESMKMHMASVGDMLVSTFGNTDRMAAAIESVRAGGAGVPAQLKDVMARTGGQPTFLVHVDARMLAKQVINILTNLMDEKMPAVPAGGPVPIMVWGKHDGRVYGGGLRVDVGGIAEMVKAMMK